MSDSNTPAVDIIDGK